jgi:hypothetical protein
MTLHKKKHDKEMPLQRRKLRGWERNKIAAAGRWRCSMCNVLLPHVFEIDHTLALSLGGDNSPGNLTALCLECHAHKTLAEAACGACGETRRSCRCREGPAPGRIESRERVPTPPTPTVTRPDPEGPISEEAFARAFEWARYQPRTERKAIS